MQLRQMSGYPAVMPGGGYAAGCKFIKQEWLYAGERKEEGNVTLH